ncbi:MAG: ABC transporter substrate-binding protein [Acidobacteriaceae bacterium]|nr:ABC transporter substrate-binding protein [Acidobacteriaceae bacterium]
MSSFGVARALPALIAAALLCSCSRGDRIVVGSKNFTEQLILGEIAAQQLERKLHITVERKLYLGGTLLAHEAIVHGDIDVYPEYTGTAGTVILKQSVPEGAVQAYIAVKDEYLKRFHLVWLPPLGFNDTFAMVVRTADAQRLTAPDLSAAASRSWRLGIGFEFLTRPDGLARLNKVYSIPVDGAPKSMDLGLLYQALRQKSVDMAAANSTDAPLTDPRFTVLKDDKKAFPPYTACYVASERLLEQRPAVRWALTLLQNRIGDDTMRALNRRVEIEHQAVEKVAADFLRTQW